MLTTWLGKAHDVESSKREDYARCVLTACDTNTMQVYGAGLPDMPAALVHAPVSLLPVAYPEPTFLLAKRAATAFNSMIDAVSRDGEYLQRVLQPAARYDDFTVSGGGTAVVAALHFDLLE